jgi:5-methylcytosine-specific restriction enzyme A
MPKINRSGNRPPWIPPQASWSRNAASNQQIYNSPRWRKLRRIFLNENPLCISCKDMGVVTAAHVVDHIIPINEGGSAWDQMNFQAMCHICHNKKSANESHRNRH